MEKIDIKPIAKRTAKEIVYYELKKAILNGLIESQKILTETMLADLLETSRTPVREAVAELTSEGLLVHIPRKGFHVREVSESEKDQIMFLRRSIEAEGVKKLAPVITDEELAALKSVVDRQETMMEKDDRVGFIELDQEFHQLLLQFAALELLDHILQGIYSLTRLIGHSALMKDGRMAEVIGEHREVIIALEEHSGEKAAEMMLRHLEITNRHVTGI